MRSTARDAAARAALAFGLVAAGVLLSISPLAAEPAHQVHPVGRAASGLSRAGDATAAKPPTHHLAPGGGFTFNPLTGVSGGVAILVGVGLFLSLVASAVALVTLRRTLYAWRSPQTLGGTAFVDAPGEEPSRSFSLIVPARHEER